MAGVNTKFDIELKIRKDKDKDKEQMRQSDWSKYQISDGIEKIGCYTGAKHTASVLIIKQQ